MLRPALAEKSKNHRDVCSPCGWSGPICMSLAALFPNSRSRATAQGRRQHVDSAFARLPAAGGHATKKQHVYLIVLIFMCSSVTVSMFIFLCSFVPRCADRSAGHLIRNKNMLQTNSRRMETVLAETMLTDLRARAAPARWCKCTGCTTREICHHVLLASS